MTKIKYFWKLNHSNFYAFDMKCIEDCHQKSVIVLCGHKVIITLVLRNSIVDQQFCIPVPASIDALTVNGHNTLCLDRSNTLSWFESTRKLKHLKRDQLVVKAIYAMATGFCEITSCDNGDLRLNVYAENDMRRIKEPDKSFDLSWPVNGQEPRSQEVHTLLHIVSTLETENLLEKMFNSTIANDVFLFSIDNVLMGLKYEHNDPSDYEIVCIKVFTSIVKRVWLSQTVGILVLLESGVLEILYIDRVLKILSQRQNFFCADIRAADLVEDDIFVCLDGDVLYQLNFYFSPAGELQCTTEEVEFEGGLAFAYVRRERTCFCITDNSLFYTIKIRRRDEDMDGQIDEPQIDFIDVDDNFLREAGDALSKLRTANTIYKEMSLKKKQATDTFQTLNVFRNQNIFANLCSATTEIRPWLPSTADFQKFTQFVPPPAAHFQTLSHAIVKVKVDPRVGETFGNGKWSVHISMRFSSTKNCDYVFGVEKLADNQLVYCIPFDHGDLLLLPKFEVELAAFVANGDDLLRCSVPVQVGPLSPRQLFTDEPIKFCHVLENRSVVDIVKRMDSMYSSKENARKSVVYIITFPQGYTKLVESLLSLNCGRKELYFFGHAVQLKYEATTRKLQIESLHPGAVFYLKNLVFDSILEAIQSDSDELSYTLPFQKHNELRAIDLGLRMLRGGLSEDSDLRAAFEKLRKVTTFFEFN